MSHIITLTSPLGNVMGACSFLAAALGRPTGSRYEIDGTILSGSGWSDDLSRADLAVHRPAFDGIVAQIASIEAAAEAARLAAEEAARNAPPAVPFCVPRRAFLLECNARGVTRAQIRTLIEQLITDATAREDALIELDTAETVERAHPLVALLGAQLQYTSEQLDAFFLAAAAR